MISRFFIKRPIASAVINTIMFIFGITCYRQLKIYEYPNIQEERVNVHVEYDGSPVSAMANIATIVEKAISSVNGVKEYTTQITTGSCNIGIILEGSFDATQTSVEVQNKINAIKHQLPRNMLSPTVTKRDVNDLPVMYTVLGSKTQKYTGAELSTKVADMTKDFKSIPGVSDISVSDEGGMSIAHSMVIALDPTKLYAYGVTANRVQQAIRNQNLDLSPAGNIIDDKKLYASIINANLSDIEEFEKMVVLTDPQTGTQILLGDLANISLAMHTRQSSFNVYNGKIVSNANIQAQSGADLVSIARTARKKIQELRYSIEDELDFNIAFDSAKYIEASLNRVYRTIIEAIVLIGAITILFFKSFRISIIPIVTLPICLASGFWIMRIFGCTINTITALAYVIAVGLVVDDAFLVVEKIEANLQKGMSIIKATIDGMKEIQYSIIGMTLTLAVVYSPFILANSPTTKTISEFAIVLAGTVIISGVVALVLTPVMCVNLMTNHHQTLNWNLLRVFENTFLSLKNAYINLLKWLLERRNQFFFICGGVFILTATIGRYNLNFKLVPSEDRGVIFVNLTFHRGTQAEDMRKVMVSLQNSVNEVLTYKNEKDSNYYFTGTESPDHPTARLLIFLPDHGRRGIRKLIKIIKKKISTEFEEYMPYLNTFGSQLDTGELRFGIRLKSIKGEKPAQEALNIVIKALSQMGGKNITFTRVNLQPVYKYTFDRNRAADLGIYLSHAEDALRALRSNPPADYYYYKKDDGSLSKTTVVTKPIESAKFLQDQDTWLVDRQNTTVPLAEILDQPGFGYEVPQILRHNGIYMLNVFCDIEEGPISVFNKLKKNTMLDLPKGVSIIPDYDLGKQMSENGTLLLFFLLAVVLIYLIMAAQFENLFSPLIILGSMPLTITGGILGLLVLPQGSINIFSILGCITLIALIAKHGIMIVDLFMQKIDSYKAHPKNKEIKEDIFYTRLSVEVARDRFRPIVMTTLAMVLGSVPLLLPEGKGYECPQQLAVVIVFGLTIGTVITTLLIPCLLASFAKFLVPKTVEIDNNIENTDKNNTSQLVH